MAVSDPVADGLTKIRNASRAKHPTVDVRPSKLLAQMLQVLQKEGFIRTVKPMGQTPAEKRLRVYLKYVKQTPAITEVVRMSKPGMRMYRSSSKLPRVLRGMRIAIVSTSSGVMTEREAFRSRVGGEVLCYVW